MRDRLAGFDGEGSVVEREGDRFATRLRLTRLRHKSGESRSNRFYFYCIYFYCKEILTVNHGPVRWRVGELAVPLSDVVKYSARSQSSPWDGMNTAGYLFAFAFVLSCISFSWAQSAPGSKTVVIRAGHLLDVKTGQIRRASCSRTA